MRPEAVDALRGCDRIIHAGDVGDPKILHALGVLAPVEAIRGNIDRADWATRLPDRLELVLGGCRIHVLHSLKDRVEHDCNAGPDVVVSGHSHKPSIQRLEGMLLVNPGSAGPRRFKLPVSIGFLHIENGCPRAELRALLP